MSERKRPSTPGDAAWQRGVEKFVARASPKSLTLQELGLEADPPREARPGEGIAVQAWIRMPETPLKVTAVAVKWTKSAVLIRWTAGDGRELEAWVWSGAVSRL